MKSVLFVGAALMIGASIYGFVDYKKTSHDKKFTRMYEDEKATVTPVTTEPVVTDRADVSPATAEEVSEKTTAAATDPAKKTAPVKKKKYKRIRAELFSRAPIREEVDLPPSPKKADQQVKEKEQ